MIPFVWLMIMPRKYLGVELDVIKTMKPTTRLNYDLMRGLPRAVVYTDCDFDTSANRRKETYSIRKAWKELNLTAVFAVDNQPTVYFAEVSQKDLEYETKLHRKLWNQGTANILIVVDPSEVRFYSAFVPPTQDTINDQNKNDLRLIETLGLSAFILQDFALQITTGTYYRARPNYFEPKNSVNTSLLGNLTVAAEKLKDAKPSLEPQQAHTLLGRLLFLLYLWDRKIIKQDGFQKKLQFPSNLDLRQFIAGENVSAETARQRLLLIFKRIQNVFNGSLFGDDSEAMERHIEESHVKILQSLIMGTIEIASGQRCLFPMYDFEMIPIEIISSIYENFLLSENPKGQRDKGAFYTPRYLAELTVDVATEDWETLLGKKYLDPACGSGIFLVILFNRIADEWRYRKPRAQVKTRLNALRDILINNLYGVDVNPTAAQITCFSLYLAFLNQMEPKDVVELQELLDTQNRQSGNGKKPAEKILPKLIGKTILSQNFFSTVLPQSHSFDLIIGNPPWTGRKAPVDDQLEKWFKSPECQFKNDFGRSVSAKKKVFYPNNQSVTGFLWKTFFHASSDTQVCFLIPTTALTHLKMDGFQAAWLPRITLDRVVQLADFRHCLFENAKRQATILKFRCQILKTSGDALFIHDTPKVENTDPRSACITIPHEYRRIVSQSNLCEEAKKNRSGSAWRRLFWGTERDFRLLNRLEEYRCLHQTITKMNWEAGFGFQPDKKGKHVRPAETDTIRCLIAKETKVDLFLLESDVKPIGTKFRHHRRYPVDRFSPPLLLINQGFSRFIYVDFSLFFQHCYQSISCPNNEQDKSLLLFLCGVLNSPLAYYYCFHTSANLDGQNEKVEKTESGRIPFPMPDDFDNPQEKWSLVRQVAKLITEAKNKADTDTGLLRRNTVVDAVKGRIKKLVYEYYEIAPWEEVLIDDTANIFAKSATPSSIHSPKLNTLAPTKTEHREAYAELLCKSINTWCRRTPLKVSANVKVASDLGLGLLVLTKSEKKEKYTEGVVSNSEITELLQMIQRSLLVETGSHLAIQKRYVHFERDCVYMIKPLEMRYWTQTAALNDADEIFAAMLDAVHKEGQ